MSSDDSDALPCGAMVCLRFVIVVFPDHTHFFYIYFAYQVRISCKGPLCAALYIFSYLENKFYVFQLTYLLTYLTLTLY